eukprot:scaffold57037_cov30-Prasinocladus_malaysianus.AAC.1
MTESQGSEEPLPFTSQDLGNEAAQASRQRRRGAKIGRKHVDQHSPRTGERAPLTCRQAAVAAAL